MECRVGAIVETLENSSRIRTAGEAKPKAWSPQRLPAPSRRCHNRTCCALNVALRYCGVEFRNGEVRVNMEVQVGGLLSS